MHYELHIPAQEVSHPRAPDFPLKSISDIRATLTPFLIHEEKVEHDLEHFGFMLGHLTAGGLFLSKEIVPSRPSLFGKYYWTPTGQRRIFLAYNVLDHPAYRSENDIAVAIELTSIPPYRNLSSLEGEWDVTLARIFDYKRDTVLMAMQNLSYFGDESLINQMQEVSHWAPLKKPATLKSRF